MKSINCDYVMVFDVESIGLHGEGYAVAWVVLDKSTGKAIEENYVACSSVEAQGDAADRIWISKNIDPHLPPPTVKTPKDVRTAFWNRWTMWRSNNTTLFSHCGWPVEALFLINCVKEDFDNRKWTGPFPLREIDDFVFITPIDTRRHPNELPEHNPLCDVRRSARMLFEAFKKLGI